MSTVQKRIVSSLYWLAGSTIAFVGIAVGFVLGFFLSGYRTGQSVHRSSIDIWDSKYNEN